MLFRSKSIRIMSLMTIMSLSFLYVYGDAFFSLWLPDEDSSLLQILLILTTVDMIFGMPLEIFWTIFTASNKIKIPAIIMLIVGILTFGTLLVLLTLFKDTNAQLMCLASTRMIWNSVKNITFLPIYGAKCLNLQWNFFFHSMAKPILGIIVTLLFCQVFRVIYFPTDWTSLIAMAIIVIIVATCIGSLFVLTNSDRQFIKQRIFKKFTA